MNDNNRIQLLGCPIDVLSMEESLRKVDEAIARKEALRHAAVNAAVLVAMKKDPSLRQSVSSCHMINADGKSVVWASRFLGKPLPERVAGPDLMQGLVKLAHAKGYRIYLLGAKDEVVKKVAEVYTHQYGSGILAGYHHGYFGPGDEKEIVAQIANSKAHMLFVAITSPKKELFLEKHAGELKIPFTMGVGGAFDIVAGITKRAPVWMQQSGLEWFYRFMQEPGRMWKRYLVTNSLFIYYVIRERLGFGKPGH